VIGQEEAERKWSEAADGGAGREVDQSLKVARIAFFLRIFLASDKNENCFSSGRGKCVARVSREKCETTRGESSRWSECLIMTRLD
jgi:hypothetical protein